MEDSFLNQHYRTRTIWRALLNIVAYTSPMPASHKSILRHLFAFLFILSFHSQAADQPLTLKWEKNMLRISSPKIPGNYVEIWYLEAFCRSHSTHQEWDKTTIPHSTELISATPTSIHLRTKVEPSVIVEHEISSGPDSVDFKVVAKNTGGEFADVQWFQPCMRVDRFTGKKQNDYIENSFILTKEGPVRLNKLPIEEDAVYKGGQVYVPSGIPREDVNPRPISKTTPVNGLIGCVSANGDNLLAMAWDKTQELFQGVIVCLHNDPRIGGLKPAESKSLHGKVYIMQNDSDALLKRYNADFKR
jgi:hypothetical protein